MEPTTVERIKRLGGFLFFQEQNTMPSATSKACSIDGCESRSRGRGWCYKHWQRNKFHGDPLHTKTFIVEGKTHAERFWKKVAVTSNPDKCWLWRAGAISTGYGAVQIGPKRWLAHRYAYFLATGIVPKLHILHSCDTPRCVNPQHLREGTDAENHADMIARGRTTKGRKAQKRGDNLTYA